MISGERVQFELDLEYFNSLNPRTVLKILVSETKIYTQDLDNRLGSKIGPLQWVQMLLPIGYLWFIFRRPFCSLPLLLSTLRNVALPMFLDLFAKKRNLV